jgi:hypothetical protein
VAAFWICLCILSHLYFRWTHRSRLDLGPTAPTVTNSAPLEPTTLPEPSGQGTGGATGNPTSSAPVAPTPQ